MARYRNRGAVAAGMALQNLARILADFGIQGQRERQRMEEDDRRYGRQVDLAAAQTGAYTGDNESLRAISERILGQATEKAGVEREKALFELNRDFSGYDADRQRQMLQMFSPGDPTRSGLEGMMSAGTEEVVGPSGKDTGLVVNDNRALQVLGTPGPRDLSGGMPSMAAAGGQAGIEKLIGDAATGFVSQAADPSKSNYRTDIMGPDEVYAQLRARFPNAPEPVLRAQVERASAPLGAAQRRLPTVQQSNTAEDPLAALPGGTEWANQVTSVQKQVMDSPAYKDYQNSLTSLMESANLVNRANELLAAGQTQGVGTLDNQNATLLARSLETGRLTDDDIARAKGTTDRAVIDRILGLYEKAVNGAPLLPGEREELFNVMQQRVMQRAQPMLEAYIAQVRAPYDGLPPMLLGQLDRALDMSGFRRLAESAVIQRGAQPAASGSAPQAGNLWLHPDGVWRTVPPEGGQ